MKKLSGSVFYMRMEKFYKNRLPKSIVTKIRQFYIDKLTSVVNWGRINYPSNVVNALQPTNMHFVLLGDDTKAQELRIALVNSFPVPGLKIIPEAHRTKELCDLAVSRSGAALANVPKKLITVELCLTAFDDRDSKFVYLYKYVPDEIRENKNFWLPLLSKREEAFNSVPWQDSDLVTAAVKGFPRHLRHVANSLKTYNLCVLACNKFSNDNQSTSTHYSDIEEILDAIPVYIKDQMRTRGTWPSKFGPWWSA